MLLRRALSCGLGPGLGCTQVAASRLPAAPPAVPVCELMSGTPTAELTTVPAARTTGAAVELLFVVGAGAGASLAAATAGAAAAPGAAPLGAAVAGADGALALGAAAAG